MEHRKGNKIKFEPEKDKKAFDIIGKIISQTLDRLVLTCHTKFFTERSQMILKAFNSFMTQKEHTSLQFEFENRYASLFSF